MEQQKEDIGDLLASKLKEGEVVTKAGLWNRINVTLDEEERKRRGTYLLWFGIGLSVLVIIFMISEGGKTKNHKNDIQNHDPLITENEKERFSEDPSTYKDSLSDDTEIVTSSEDLFDSTSTVITSKTDSKHTKLVKKNVTKSNPKAIYTDDIDYDSYQVTENYYYYNSANDTTIVTTNKKVMDSLINTITIQDSIPKND